MKVSEYINSISLKFKNPIAEREFNIIRNQEIKYYNLKLCIYFFILTTVNTTLTLCSIEKAKSLGKNNTLNLAPITYSLSTMSLLLIILSKFIKKNAVGKFIVFIIFLGIKFPIQNINTIIWEIHLENKDLYSLLILFYLAPRGIMMSLQILSFLECLIVNFIEILLFTLNFYFTNQISRIFISLFFSLIQIMVSYIMTRKFKQSLLFTWASNERNKYQNIFENMKSSFLNFSNKKIKFINKNFQQTILKNKEIKNIQVQSETNSNFKEMKKK